MSELSDQLRRYTNALEVGDFETMGEVLDIACQDMQLSDAIFRWHEEHDDVQITEARKQHARKIVQDVMDKMESEQS